MEHTLTASLVVGYVYFMIARMIPISISYEIDILCMIVFAIIFGYVLGRFLRSKLANDILVFLKIRETGNLYYWDDIMDNKYPMKIRITYEDVIYEGMSRFYESYSNEPHVVLGSYISMDVDGAIKENHTDDNNRTIVLNTSNAKAVEIIYAKDSDMCDDIKNLYNSNKELFIKDSE